MRRINEEMIRTVIERQIGQGADSFVIYPFGAKGKLVKKTLNEAYGIKEKAIIDNKLSESDASILHSKELEAMPKDWVVLLASHNKENYQEIRSAVCNDTGRVVCDIAEAEAGKFLLSYNKMAIEQCDSEQLQQIFDRTKREWMALGEQDPYWSVLTHEEYKSENINEEALRKFYASGWLNVAKIVNTLSRNEVVNNWDELKELDITEVGCGCGRITKGLSQVFKSVTALDISKGNLTIARDAIDAENVDLRLITDLNEYRNLPKTDIVYSYLVLQHNTPPVIEYIIGEMLKSLKVGGIAIFQVPTYNKDYVFDFENYMTQKEGMELHLLPQKKIWEIAYENHCIPLEVYSGVYTREDYNSVMITLKKLK